MTKELRALLTDLIDYPTFAELREKHPLAVSQLREEIALSEPKADSEEATEEGSAE